MARASRPGLGIPALLCLTAVLGCVLCGCGKKADRSTPAACVTTLHEAMQSGDFATAAECFDYETNAKQQNEDWSTFADSQRKLIIGKLQENKAAALQGAAQAYAQQAYEIGEASESGSQATVQLKSSQGATTVQLVKSGEEWLVLQFPGL